MGINDKASGGVQGVAGVSQTGDLTAKDWLNAGTEAFVGLAQAIAGGVKETEKTPQLTAPAAGSALPQAQSILTAPSPVAGLPWWVVGVAGVGLVLLLSSSGRKG